MSLQALRNYADFFEQMTPANVARLREFMTDDVRFADPFNDVTGIDGVLRIFEHMFESLDSVSFNVTHVGIDSSNAQEGMLRWELDGVLSGKPWVVKGMSEIGFSADGRINRHIDHWDSGQQFYERLPLLGSVLRAIRKRLQVSGQQQ